MIISEGNTIKMAEKTEKTGTEQEKDRELEILRMYLEDVKAVKPPEEGEREALLQSCAGSGERADKSAKQRIMALYLMDTLQIASEYRGQGMSLSDLIQEANMGLILALEEMIAEDSLIKQRIREAVEAALSEEGRAEALGEHLAEEINRLDEASQALTERKGEAPTIEELTEYLGMPEDEIREYMKISLDAINAGLQK